MTLAEKLRQSTDEDMAKELVSMFAGFQASQKLLGFELTPERMLQYLQSVHISEECDEEPKAI